MIDHQLITCDCGREVLDIDLHISPDGSQIRCENCHTPPALAFLTTGTLADLKLGWEIEKLDVHPDYLIINGRKHFTL